MINRINASESLVKHISNNCKYRFDDKNYVSD